MCVCSFGKFFGNLIKVPLLDLVNKYSRSVVTILEFLRIAGLSSTAL